MTEDEAVFHQKLYRVVEMRNGGYKIQVRPVIHFVMDPSDKDPWKFVDNSRVYDSFSTAEEDAKRLKAHHEAHIKAQIVRNVYDPV